MSQLAIGKQGGCGATHVVMYKFSEVIMNKSSCIFKFMRFTSRLYYPAFTLVSITPVKDSGQCYILLNYLDNISLTCNAY